MDTVDSYPAVGLMLGGSGFAGIYKGRFELVGYGKGRLFLKKRIRPYIYIKFKNNDFVFFNLKSSRQTVEFYGRLQNEICFYGPHRPNDHPDLVGQYPTAY
jgi:hypothetical protein